MHDYVNNGDESRPCLFHESRVRRLTLLPDDTFHWRLEGEYY